MPDDLTIIANGQSISGWQQLRVTRGCERVPSSFDITATERYPNQIADVAIWPFQPCQIILGSDLVLTGYVDRVIPSISAAGHQVRIQGRSKLEDIVDCAVNSDIVKGMQVSTGSLLNLANLIGVKFGITAKSLTGDNIPVSEPGGSGQMKFNVILSETGYDVIERVARYLQVLVYDDTDGNIILSRTGSASAASGFQQGVNVQSASAVFSGDQRFSVYLPMLMSYKFFGEDGSSAALAPVYDKTVHRYRPTVVISEQFLPGSPMAEQRAKWEEARRYGRSQAVRLVVDSWRDSAGKLWTPNTLAPISLPALKLTPKDPWVIASVTYARDLQRGTTAEIELMPKQAFDQEPILLVPMMGNFPGLASQGGASAAAPPSQVDGPP